MSDWKNRFVAANIRPFDPYKVLPNLEPYRYTFSAIRQYNSAIRRQLVRPKRETGTLFDTPTQKDDDDVFFHCYLAHACKSKTLLTHGKRILSDFEYATQFLPSMSGKEINIRKKSANNFTFNI